MSGTIDPDDAIVGTGAFQAPIKDIPRICGSDDVECNSERAEIDGSADDAHFFGFCIVANHFEVFGGFVGDAFGVAGFFDFDEDGG